MKTCAFAGWPHTFAVHLWRQQSFEILRAMLRDETQLLRFDAVSALAREVETKAVAS